MNNIETSMSQWQCGKVYYPNTIIISIFMWTLVPNCQFEKSSLSNFAI